MNTSLIFTVHFQFDAEILVYEKKSREQIQHLEAISQELSKTDQIFRQGSEQVCKLLVFQIHF